MNQIIAILYPPGAYGSFMSWTVDRFSRIRRRFEPAITDEPLSSDGSSHAHASLCDIGGLEEFLDGMRTARLASNPWMHQVHAGWPIGSSNTLDDAIDAVLTEMSPYDKLISIEPTDPDMVYIAYLRAEATIDPDRWHAMMGISEGDDESLIGRLSADVSRPRSRARDDDPRWLRLGMGNLLNYNTEPQLFDMIAKHLAWPVIDRDLFVQECKRMRGMQQRFFAAMSQAKQGTGSTPVQKAIHMVHTKRRG